MKKSDAKVWIIIALACVVVLAGLIALVVRSSAKKHEAASLAALSSDTYRELYSLKNTPPDEADSVNRIIALTNYYSANASVESSGLANDGEHKGYAFRLKKISIYEVQSAELEQQAKIMLTLIPELSYVQYDLGEAMYHCYRQYGEETGGKTHVVESDKEMQQYVKDGYQFQTFMDSIRPLYVSQSIHETIRKHLLDLAIKKQGEDEEVLVEGHRVVNAMGGEKISVYALTSIGSYRFVNGALARLTDRNIEPAIYTLVKNANGSYEFEHVDFHPIGATTEEAIRQMFVTETAENVLNNLATFQTDLKSQEEAQAKAHASSLGREAAITDLRAMELTYLDSMDIAEEVVNKILANPQLLSYPLWVGNQEFVEEGVRYIYETAYHNVDNTIRFQKLDYHSKKAVEEFKVSASTGDYVG